MPFKNLSNKKQSGYLLVLVLVFGSVFLVMISSFIGFVVSQNQVVNFRHEQQRATEIAEAGLNYYRWYLAHFPDDLTTTLNNTYSDQESNLLGEYTLDINRNSFCGSTASIEVSATAFTYDDPSAISTVRARYARPTVAEYSFITNDGVWYGSSGVVVGPLHSNQGVRMDSAHNSTIGSGQADWVCDGSYGCTPTQTVDGVYTTSGLANPGLFSFPVSPISFAGLTLDLSDMRTRSQNNGGIYYPDTTERGYLVEFNGDGTVDIYTVRADYNYRSYSVSELIHWGERNVITGQTLIATRTIDPDCPLLFFEDKVWVQGDVNQKVTLAAADLSSGAQTNVVLNGDIEYVPGSDAGLLVIAEDDIDVGVDIPNDMDISGIFIAQNGSFGRNYYSTSWFNNTYDPYVIRNSLDVLGTIVTNGRSITNWVNGSGNTITGIRTGASSFDRDQIINPPPLTPETSDVFIFDSWRQDG